MIPPDVPSNTRHPGWPDYVGPWSGWALLGHHDILVEYWPDFAMRVREIREKPVSQHASRFRHFVVLAEEDVPPEVRQAQEAVEKAWKDWMAGKQTQEAVEKAWKEAREARDTAEMAARPALGAVLARYVPDHRWDGTEIVFDKEE